MGRVNTPKLSDSEKISLRQGFREGKSHCYRMCCYLVLLKSEGKTSKEVGKLTNMSDASVNSWLKRYQSEGLLGLEPNSPTSILDLFR